MQPGAGPRQVKNGDVLGGKYRVERVLGQGGMGLVVEAIHLRLGQRVAIKFLLPEALEKPQVVARFAREARAAATLHSDHVARVIDVGEFEEGAPYMVLEYLHGSTLAAIIEKDAPLVVADAVDYVLQACEALAEAHAAGIVHRDVKPANLFLAERPGGAKVVKVLDFGISKATANEPDFALTGTAEILGSPLYMSPEQLRSTREVDARTDIWSVGVVLYELLSGQLPFVSESMPDLCGKIFGEVPRALKDLRSDIPIELDLIVQKCLSKDPGGRFSNVATLAQALVAFGPRDAWTHSQRINKILLPVGEQTLESQRDPAGPPPPQTATAATWDRSSSLPRTGAPTRSRVWIAAAATVATVILVGAYWTIGRPQIAPPSAASALVTPMEAMPSGSVAPALAPSPAVETPPLPAASEKAPPSASAPPPAAKSRGPRSRPGPPAGDPAGRTPVPTSRNPLDIDFK